MATFISELASLVPRRHLILARAPRVAGVVARLLLALLLVLPIYAFVTAGVPLGAAPAIVVGLFVLALVRPGAGLLVCAGLLVLSGPIAAIVRCEPHLTEPLMIAFLAGWVLHDTLRPQAPVDAATRRIVMPALLLASVVAASVLVQLSVQQVSVDYPWPFVRQVVAHLGSDYIVFGSRFEGLDRGAAMLEGIGLFVAVLVLSRRFTHLGPRAAVMMAAGGTGVAVLNGVRFMIVCLRTASPLHAFVANLRGLRISAAFADYNAAGSYLAMMTLVALGFAAASRRTRLVWIAVSFLMVGALWLTGSRSALIAMPACGVLLLAWIFCAGGRPGLSWRKPVLGAAVGIACLLLLVGRYFPPDVGARPLGNMLQGRVVLAHAALKVSAAYPLFGVGIGRFSTVAGAYLSPEMRQPLEHENAHNNFLQLLAELGLAGFLPFAWILGLLGWRVLVAVRIGNAVLAGVATGLLAFLVTCLVGHPLLIREVAFSFWLMLGILAALAWPALTVDDPPARRPSWKRTAAHAVILALAISVPVRAQQFIDREADLRGAAIGFSRWQMDAEVGRYRTMVGRAEFYVAANACVLTLPMRAEANGRPEVVDVDISVEGTTLAHVRAITEMWKSARIMLPAVTGRRFAKIEFRTPNDSGTIVRVARPQVAYCGRVLRDR